MKKTQTRIIAATAEPMTGSPSRSHGGIDVSALYIDMLCEKFRNRGIRTGALDPARQAEVERNARMLGLSHDEVSARDEKYQTMKIGGRSYMSCDDFAAYYKDLRGYRLPNFYTRAENEYEKAEADAKCVQESGKPPKKAVWLAVKKNTKEAGSRLVSEFVVDEFKEHFNEEVIEGESAKMPKQVIPALLIVTLSLLLIVCSSVMVSRASGEVSKLENQIEALEVIRNDLDTDLEVKNNMLNIKELAVEEYGMISADYAASRYLDIAEDEKIDIYDKEEKGESLLSQLLRAIGLKAD
ncbi:MAG: hypothetical protein IJY39_08155 [Clostridia bacterium]|nr:hypothetical protein [Clostridia bacterium]